MITYQFANATNWESLWSGNLTAVTVSLKPLEQFNPIPETTIPIQITSPIVAIYASSNSARDTWKYAGSIYQKLQTGLTVGGTPDSYLSSRKFYLKQITICRFTPLDSNYALEVRIPYWIRDIHLQVWQYTGPINDSHEQKLDLILSEIQN